MSDYTVEWDEHDATWYVMDVGMKFDGFDTEAEAIHEKYLLDSTMEIEEELYRVGKQYNAEQLNYFIRCFNLYGMKSIWGGLLKDE